MQSGLIDIGANNNAKFTSVSYTCTCLVELKISLIIVGVKPLCSSEKTT